MSISSWFGLGWLVSVIVCGSFASQTDMRPHRMDICWRYAHGEKTTQIWSDQLKRYTYHYPATTCGTCAKEVPCPE